MMKLHARDRRTTGWSQQNWWHGMKVWKRRFNTGFSFSFLGIGKMLKRWAFFGGSVVKINKNHDKTWMAFLSFCILSSWWGTPGSWNKTNARQKHGQLVRVSASCINLNFVWARDEEPLVIKLLLHALFRFWRVILQSEIPWDHQRCIKLAFPCACWHFFLSPHLLKGDETWEGDQFIGMSVLPSLLSMIITMIASFSQRFIWPVVVTAALIAHHPSWVIESCTAICVEYNLSHFIRV